MKNYIDNKFYNLVKKIEKNDVYNIYTNIVKNFSSLNIGEI